VNIIRKKPTAKKVGFHPSHLMRLARAGRFPSPVRLGPNSVGFIEEEVNAWIAERAAERDEAGERGDG
jgi:prophage regulatory protein